MNTRESGWYWVKWEDEWQPAEWMEAKGEWWLPNSVLPTRERDMEAIEETRLIPPNEQG